MVKPADAAMTPANSKLRAGTGGILWPAALFQPPRGDKHIVRRAGLEQCLVGHLERQVSLTAIGAPPGYGKTTLLRRAYLDAAARGSRVTWINLSPAHGSLDRFAADVIGAVQSIEPGFGVMALRLLMHGVPASDDFLQALLLNDLVALRSPIHLFLDNAQWLDGADPTAFLHRLFRESQHRLSLVVAGQGNIGARLQLSRLDPANLMSIGVDQLSLQPEESVAVLNALANTPYTAAHARQIHEHTQGWALGLVLMHSAVANATALPASQAKTLPEPVAAYFDQAVLAQLSHKQCRQLSCLAAFPAFNAEMLDTCVADHCCANDLEMLVLHGWFCGSANDYRSGWYCLHPLLRQHLRNRWTADDSREADAACRIAEDWAMDKDRRVLAVSLAIERGDWEAAASLLARHCWPIWQDGQELVVLKLIELLPPTVLLRFPALLVFRSLLLGLIWQFDEARQVIKDLEQAIAAGRIRADERFYVEPGQHGPLGDGITLARMILAFMTEDQAMLHEATEQWFACRSEALILFDATTEACRIWHDILAQDFSRLSERIQRVSYLSRTKLSPIGQLWMEVMVGAALFEAGEPNSAIVHLQQAEFLASQLARLGHDMSHTPRALRAMALYDTDQIDAALEAIRHTDGDRSAFGHLARIAIRAVARARLEAMDARPDRAERTLSSAAQQPLVRSADRSTALLLYEQVRLACLAADSAAIERLETAIERLGRTTAHARQLCVLASARIALHRSQPAAVRDQLTPRLDGWLGAGAHRAVVQAGILLAAAHQALSARSDAERVLKRVLELMHVGGMIRPVLDDLPLIGETLLPLCRRLVHAGSPVSDICRRLLESSAADELSRARDGLDDKLQAREREILTLTARGFSNFDIGAELGLTESTVKWYMRQIYDKLGVRRRTLAVHVARQRGYIAV